jgi:hypothetical protein
MLKVEIGYMDVLPVNFPSIYFKILNVWLKKSTTTPPFGSVVFQH